MRLGGISSRGFTQKDGGSSWQVERRLRACVELLSQIPQDNESLLTSQAQKQASPTFFGLYLQKLVLRAPLYVTHTQSPFSLKQTEQNVFFLMK